MNDIKNTYFEEQQEKNRLAQSGRLAGFKTHPISGKKKIEPAEVATMNLNEPMDYAEFKKLPNTMKKKYLEHLFETYDCTTGAIAEMLGCSKCAMSETTRRLGIKKGKNRGIGKNDTAFRAWVEKCREAARMKECHEVKACVEEGDTQNNVRQIAIEEPATSAYTLPINVVLTKEIAEVMTASAIGELVKAICLANGYVTLKYEVPCPKE